MNVNLSCIIVDDEPVGIQLIGAFLHRIPFVECRGSFEDATTALDFLKTHEVDILITDIGMPGVSGIQMVRLLPALPEVIFTTAHRDFATDGFDLDVVDYLLKPISFQRFQVAINKVRERLELRKASINRQRDFLFIKEEDAFIKISCSDIAFMEANGDYVKIFRKDNSSLLTRKTMAEMENLLPSHFIRVHKSYIANIESIASVSQLRITLHGGHEIPISRSYKDIVNKRMGIG